MKLFIIDRASLGVATAAAPASAQISARPDRSAPLDYTGWRPGELTSREAPRLDASNIGSLACKRASADARRQRQRRSPVRRGGIG